MKTSKTVNDKINSKLIDLFKENNIDIDISYHLGYSEGLSNFEELSEFLENEGALNIEIIYYHKAIDFLKENDPSLVDSIGLATDYGCAIDNLNSEFLASILATDILRVQFFELENEINEIFDLKK
tara:strand:- start:156 stop:533 length:378 start_codon:yes stop_codon:yes gene_type:complete